jgi:hypothetical protein
MKLILIFTLLLIAWAWPAAALNFFELEVYPATTEGQGLHELESQNSFVASGRDRAGHRGAGGAEDPRRHHLERSSLEYNYGLTDKIDVALYLDTEKPNGEDVEFGGFRARARGALWEQGRYPVDLGWYFEVEMPAQEEETQVELEFRPIISRAFGRFTIDLDPMFELPTVTQERRTLEFNYATRIGYRLSRAFEPSLEFYGSIGQIRAIDPSREQEHYIFPVANFHVGGVKMQVGPGFGLTRGSDSVIVKFNVEYEFTIP